MKTKIIIYRSGTGTNTFYYIDVTTQDHIGFVHTKSTALITEQQYNELRNFREEKFANGINYIEIA